MFRYALFYFICLLNLFYAGAQEVKALSVFDSIQKLHDLVGNRDSDLIQKLKYANQSIKLSKELNNDTLLLKSNVLVSELSYGLDSLELFKKVNLEALRLSTKLNDSAIIASSNSTLGVYYQLKSYHDSAYYYYNRAIELFEAKDNIRRQSEVLINMSGIQFTEKDYVGSEANAIKALTVLITLPQNEGNLDSLWILYNLLGNISVNLKEYNQSIDYHNKAIEISEKLSDNFFYITSSKTNLAFTYAQAKNYDEAIKIYYNLLNNYELLDIDSETYAIVLSNMAYARFLKGETDYIGIEEQFNEAHKVAENLNNIYNLSGILNDKSEFLFSIGEEGKAVAAVNRAYEIAKETNYNEEVLESLNLLSTIKKGDEAAEYLRAYVKLNDSLFQAERIYRNKFARIEFETDQLEEENAIIEAENAQISKERLLFLLLSIGLMLSLTLLYIVITQRSKNKELRFKQEQQEANEEIYNLMLAQQDKIEEGRTKEKKRISQELHDGVLGRLFGTRLSLDSLNMVNTNEAIENREQYINELKTIEQDIRKISHDLNADFIGNSSFMDIVKALVENQTTAYGLDYNFSDDEAINWDEFSNKNKIHIYRMLQECMQNIYKHAKAKSINIRFSLKNSVTLIAIEDDGVGFNTDKAKKGIGIKNINSRVEELDGKVDINSEIGKGTSIIISIPY